MPAAWSAARAFAKRMNVPLSIIDKRRLDVNVAEVMHIIGEVEGRHCLIVDDLIDTAGTLVKGAEAIQQAGALSVRACATHGVLSGNAVERIEESPLEEVVLSNSIRCGTKPCGRRRSGLCRSRACWPGPSSRSTKADR